MNPNEALLRDFNTAIQSMEFIVKNEALTPREHDKMLDALADIKNVGLEVLARGLGYK